MQMPGPGFDTCESEVWVPACTVAIAVKLKETMKVVMASTGSASSDRA